MIALQAWFVIAIALSVAGMKWSSLRVTPLYGAQLGSFVCSPALSVSSWRNRRPRTRAWLRETLVRLLLLSAALVTCWWLYLDVVPRIQPSTWVQGYLGAVPLYLLTHVGSLLMELAFSSTGWSYPSHMRWPMLAHSIDAFWSRRWGTWVSDWFRQVVFSRYRRQPLVGMLVVFVASGIWHEVLVDVPLLVFLGINAMGGWLLYFFIQAVAALIERRFIRHRTWLGYAYTWAVILLPAPLAVNQATLRVIGLYV